MCVWRGSIISHWIMSSVKNIKFHHSGVCKSRGTQPNADFNTVRETELSHSFPFKGLTATPSGREKALNNVAGKLVKRSVWRYLKLAMLKLEFYRTQLPRSWHPVHLLYMSVLCSAGKLLLHSTSEVSSGQLSWCAGRVYKHCLTVHFSLKLDHGENFRRVAS